MRKKPPVDQKSTAARRTMVSTMIPPSKVGVGQRGDGQCPTLNSDELNSKEVEVLWLIPWSTHKKSVIPPIHSVIVILHKKIRPNLQIYVFITMTKNEITVRTHSSLLGKKNTKETNSTLSPSWDSQWYIIGLLLIVQPSLIHHQYPPRYRCFTQKWSQNNFNYFSHLDSVLFQTNPWFDHPTIKYYQCRYHDSKMNTP